MCKASHSLLSAVSEQRFAYHLDMLVDHKCSMNLRNKLSQCENKKKQETISMWPGKGTCQEVWSSLS